MKCQEAEERPILFGDASPARSHNEFSCCFLAETQGQRESTASIMGAPRTYDQSSPPQKQNIIDIDCRGLEFTEFQANVQKTLLDSCRNWA